MLQDALRSDQDRRTAGLKPGDEGGGCHEGREGCWERILLPGKGAWCGMF